MAQLDEFNKEVWSDLSIFRVENHIVNNIFACRTTDAVEAAITYSTFLRKSGLTNENYPLWLKLLEVENHWVIDALIRDKDPFLLLSPIPPNSYLMLETLQAADQVAPGGHISQDPVDRAGDPAGGVQLAEGRVQDLPGEHQRREQPGQAPEQGDGPGGVRNNRAILDILDRLPPWRGRGRGDGAAGTAVPTTSAATTSTSGARWRTPSRRCCLSNPTTSCKEVLPVTVFED